MAAFRHHDNQGHDVLMHCAILKGLIDKWINARPLSDELKVIQDHESDITISPHASPYAMNNNVEELE